MSELLRQVVVHHIVEAVANLPRRPQDVCVIPVGEHRSTAAQILVGSASQADSETLQQKLDSATLHMVVLEALSGVRGASLAVAADDYAGARLSLIQASDALDTLAGLLAGTDQKDVLTSMQQSAAQALTDVQTDLKSAQPELDQFTQNLVQLEENLFPSP